MPSQLWGSPRAGDGKTWTFKLRKGVVFNGAGAPYNFKEAYIK
jgi:ABC-type transport system substrate-binding protein